MFEAAVAADGLVKFLVDCLGRVAAARLSAGRRRNMLDRLYSVQYRVRVLDSYQSAAH